MNQKALFGKGGFTLLEMMVVILILGILATIIVPRFVGQTDEARRKAAMVQIRNLEDGLNMYRIDNGIYPTTEQGLDALVRKPASAPEPTHWREGGYFPKIPLDPWGRAYVYLSPGSHGEYDLISYGGDGEPGGEGKNEDIESWDIR
jgi:general secretion pathway protein G